jgi:hypothetical protein
MADILITDLDTTPRRISERDFRRANPNVSFPETLSGEMIAPYGAAFAESADPVPDGKRIVSTGFRKIDDVWKQVHDLEDIPPPKASDFVLTPTQFHTALRVNGLDATVKAAIGSISDPIAQASAEVRLEYASVYRRDEPLVASLAAAIGLTDAQVDAMWLAAKDYP